MSVLQTRSIGVEFDVEETLDKVESAGDASQLSLLKVGVDCFLEKIRSGIYTRLYKDPSAEKLSKHLGNF